MTGGLMQLVAIGLADTYLTGNPQITFFRNVYRSYNNLYKLYSLNQFFIYVPWGADLSYTPYTTAKVP